MSAIVCYHLPCDHDEADHPNAFVIHMNPTEITLRDVKAAFPLPGNYHFRFKVEGGFWMDATDENAHVPLFGHKRIVAKILRLSWTSVEAVTKAAPALPQFKPATSAPSMDLFSSTPTAQPARKENPKNNVSDFDLFN